MSNEQLGTECEYCGEWGVVMELGEDAPFLFCTLCAQRSDLPDDALRELTPEVLTKLRTSLAEVETHNASIDGADLD